MAVRTGATTTPPSYASYDDDRGQGWVILAGVLLLTLNTAGVVLLLLAAATAPAWVIVATVAMMFSGAPELQLMIPPSCHRSTNRWINPGALLRNARFGPNGNSNVPLVLNAWVR